MGDLRMGILLWSQGSEWAPFMAAARRCEELGYESLWTWDHLYAIFGDPYQPIFEGYTALAGLATATERMRIGLLVGANTFRHPGVVAKAITTIDHISGGRAMCGLGGAWMELEHTANGIDFGSGFGQRLDWLDESAGIVRRLLAGETVTHEGPRYRTTELSLHPLPVQARLPIMIGGSGERKTLRTVAKYADMWNTMGLPEFIAGKVRTLEEHCDAVGRDIAEIERTVSCKVTIRDSEAEARRFLDDLMVRNRTPRSRYEDNATFWVGTPEQVADKMLAIRALGFDTFISEMPAPYDVETLERWIGQVKPMVERG
ncbi:MAG: LLM class flavin-dependent oxidoreductase [Solirubrobacteraceae bacterium]